MGTTITLAILSIGDRFRLRRFRLPRHFMLCGGPNESPSWVWTNLPAEAKLDLVDTVLPERQDVSGIHRHFRQEKGHANPWATARGGIYRDVCWTRCRTSSDCRTCRGLLARLPHQRKSFVRRCGSPMAVAS